MSKKVHKYRNKLLDAFYLDKDDVTVRRRNDCVYKRFLADDVVKPYIDANGYPMIHIPFTRASINLSHIVCLLRELKLPEDVMVDHIDGNRLNQSRNNLRFVTHALNNRNRSIRSDNISGITGIRWSKYHNHYVIRRTVGERRLSRSRKTIEEAVAVLDELKALDNSYTERHGL